MICTKEKHQGGENCQTCIEHAVFKRASEERKKRQIAKGYFRIEVSSQAAGTLNELWEGWCETLGKGRAVDFLVVSMTRADEALRASLDEKKVKAANERKVGPVKFTKVSAPRVED